MTMNASPCAGKESKPSPVAGRRGMTLSLASVRKCHFVSAAIRVRLRKLRFFPGFLTSRSPSVWVHIFFRMGTSLSISLALFAACGPATQPYIWGNTHPSLKAAPPAHQLGPSDKLFVFVGAQAELSGEHTVSPEGEIVQPLLGTIRVTGMTTDQLKQLLRQKLARFVSNPEVSVTLTQARELRITALGEVREPGQFLVPPDESLLGVIGRARGLTEFADSTSIYVVRRSPKAERIRFRFENLIKPDSTVTFRLQDGDSIVVE